MFEGDGEAAGVVAVLVGALAVVEVAAAVVDLVATAELVVPCGVGDALGEAEVAVCVGLAEALVASTDVRDDAADADADTDTVSDPGLIDEVAAPAATSLPAGLPSPPPTALPYNRNATTMMAAKPPVSMSPTPRRFSARRSARDRWSSDAA